MQPFLSAILVASHLAKAAIEPCPLLGASFPKPQNLASDPAFAAATAKLSEMVTQSITTAALDATSFSAQIFSSDAESLWQFHHTSPKVANGTVGVKEVNAESVYRLGSISKLLTTYLFLVSAGSTHWDEPITKHVPELRRAANVDSVADVVWEEVTLGSLASQLAGIGRQTFGDLSTVPGFPTQLLGLPTLNTSNIPPCKNQDPCSRNDFFDMITNHAPVFPSYTTPIYSNIGFRLLGYVLESITGRLFPSLLEDKLFRKLDMVHSSYSMPIPSVGVIPGNETTSGWNQDLGEDGPAGGIYSSTSDLAKLGQSILKNTLLSPLETRKWLKPHTHTSSSSTSVGMPWEITRIPLPNEHNRIVDVYTKNGGIGVYGTIFALIPEYGLGFSILAAGPSPGFTHSVISGHIANSFMPDLEALARQQAHQRFAGTYTSVNASITITTEDGKPGLGIANWINNGVDILQAILSLQPGALSISFRLYPAFTEANKKSVSFRAVIKLESPPPPGRVDSPFSDRCRSWAAVDGLMYGNIAFEDFVFCVDEHGMARTVFPRVMRVEMFKEA